MVLVYGADVRPREWPDNVAPLDGSLEDSVAHRVEEVSSHGDAVVGGEYVLDGFMHVGRVDCVACDGYPERHQLWTTGPPVDNRRPATVRCEAPA